MPPPKSPKSVRFDNAANVHEFTPDEEHDAKRKEHWRQIQNALSDKKWHETISNTLRNQIAEIRRVLPTLREGLGRRNLVALRNIAEEIRESQLEGTHRLDLFKWFRDTTAKWPKATEDEQVHLESRIMQLRLILQKDTEVYIQAALRMNLAWSQDQKGAMLAMSIPFFGTRIEVAEYWLQSFCFTHGNHGEGDLKTPKDWLLTWHSLLQGRARQWANSDEIISGIIEDDALEEVEWHTVDMVQEIFLSRWAVT